MDAFKWLILCCMALAELASSIHRIIKIRHAIKEQTALLIGKAVIFISLDLMRTS